MKKPFNTIIFDLDGTLVDTIADIAFFMNKALQMRELPVVPEAEYKKLVGWGMKRLALNVMPPDMRENALADALSDELAADATRFYMENPVIKTKPYDGIPQTLTELRRRKFKIAVLSNKPDAAAQAVTRLLFLQNTFDIVQGDSAGKPRKPSPDPVWDILMELDASPRDTLFLGDSEIDMETALAAGCHAVGAAWGFRGRKTLEQSGAERVIDKPADLLEVL